MWYELIKRLITSIPVLLGLSLLAFFLVRLIPGDTASAILGLRYTEEAAEALRIELGLNKAWYIQYGIWLKSVLKGDLGLSAVSGESVIQEVASRLLVSAELAGLALLLGSMLGFLLGLSASVLRKPFLKNLAKFVAVIGVSVPNFWLATMLIMIFSLYAGILPASSYTPWSEGASLHIKSMVLPVLTLTLAVMAVVTRMAQASISEVLQNNYIQTAIAKGLSRWQMICRHAIKNALSPVITIIGLQAGSLLGGSVVVEQVFALPGIGQLVLQAVGNRDYPMLQGLILLSGSFFILINIVVDLVYRWLDPRIGDHIS